MKNILETRRILQAREKEQLQTIKANYIDIRLSFSKIEKLGYTVELSKYYNDGNSSVLSVPEQTIELLPPSKEVVLSDQRPHELLRVSLKNVRENEETGEIYFSTVHTANIFTGSVYRMGVANLTRSVDVDDSSVLRKSDRFNVSSRLSNLKSKTREVTLPKFS